MNAHTLAEVQRRYPDEFLVDDRTVVATLRALYALDIYDGTLPTAPSPGRVYLRRGWVYVVAADPDDSAMVLHHPHEVLVVEQPTG